MARYSYPASITGAEDGYTVVFPDIPGCATGGKDLSEALLMASDALGLMLYDMEQSGAAIPAPSALGQIPAPADGFVNYISCDTDILRRRYGSRAVKKTLTIPEWLNEAASAAGINFSQVLQAALKEKLGLN